MKTVIRIGNRVKPTHEKGLEQIPGMEIDAKVELIQALIPLGLMHVVEELKKEVAQLAGPRHSREQGLPGHVRWGRQTESVYILDQKVPVVVPRVRDLARRTEIPLSVYRSLQAPRNRDDGRRFRALTLVDHFTRESPGIEVGNSIPGRRVVTVLERLAKTHGLPQVITTDNGTEFTSRAVDEWAHRNGVKLDFIRPGKPIKNAYIESFNGRLRQECLEENWFMSLEDAKIKIEAWRKDYNEHRPHSSLKDETPQAFAEDWQLSRTAKAAGILT
jgi:transposase InsO family protein